MRFVRATEGDGTGGTGRPSPVPGPANVRTRFNSMVALHVSPTKILTFSSFGILKKLIKDYEVSIFP